MFLSAAASQRNLCAVGSQAVQGTSVDGENPLTWIGI
jgi:hypothetical protein